MSLAPSQAQRLSLAEVTSWLRENNYGTTALELHDEVLRCTGERYAPLLQAAEECRKGLESRDGDPAPSGRSPSGTLSSSTHSSPVPSPEGTSAAGTFCLDKASATTALRELLKRFSEVEGEDQLREALQECVAAQVPTSHPVACAPSTVAVNPSTSASATGAPSPVNTTNEELVQQLTTQLRQAESQLKQLTIVVADSLGILVTAVDPVHKDVLLPLLRATAVLSQSVTSRAGARHAMLTLYKRPTMENRATVVAEWLHVARAAPRRALEQEIIPELYGLVNANTSERRELAVDCGRAVAELIQDSAKLRWSICQGLLRPLSEDESSSVRRAVPTCLAALWDAPEKKYTAAHSPLDVSDSSNASLLSQSTFPLELGVRLALDAYSNSVRHAAQEQLSEVIFPICERDGTLLSTVVPLLMTLIGREVAPLRAEELSMDTGSTNASRRPAGAADSPQARESAAASPHAPAPLPHFSLTGRKQTAGAPGAVRTTSSRTLAYSNIVMLVKLCGAAVHCVKTALAERRDREDGAKAAGVDAVRRARESTNAAVRRACDAFLRVVLPTAYSLLPPLLQAFANGLVARRYVGRTLCGLGVYLAALVPALDASSWKRVQAYLMDSVRFTAGEEPPQPSGGSWASSLGLIGGTGQDAPVHGRTLFLYIVLTRLSGERSSAANKKDEDGPTLSAHDCARTCASEIGRECVLLVIQNVTTKASRLTTDDRLRILALCLGHLSAISLGANDCLAVGVTAVLWGFAESAVATQRLHAIFLITQICTQQLDDDVKTSLVCPPLLVLLNDADATVQELAVKGLLTVATGLSRQGAQEKLLRPALAVVEASGCTSDLTHVVLGHWESLLPVMAAEPREALLYPLLNVFMDQLSEQQGRRTLRQQQQQRSSGTSTPKSGAVPTADAEERQEQAKWERVVGALQSLLAAILRCPVVTPWLVAKHLLPGIRHLSSDGAPSGILSPALRARWEQLNRSYVNYIESNSLHVAGQQAANLLNRVKDELKRRF